MTKMPATIQIIVTNENGEVIGNETALDFDIAEEELGGLRRYDK